MTSFYRNLLRPLLFRFPAETAHELALHFLSAFSATPGLLRIAYGAPPSRPVDLFGLRFPNPVGLAAGMDKNAVALPGWEALGFGFVEAGTITALPQPGNPKPRVFRYPSRQALVNRMGFNNQGCDLVAARLERLKNLGRWPSIPIGLNLGKSKITPLEKAAEDYLTSYRRLYELGDYFVVNVSSPNTPGLRTLQAADELSRILGALRDWEGGAHKPLLVKLSPDLDPVGLREAVAVSEENGADGLIATNTTLDHSSLNPLEDQQGGLSGLPLQKRASEIARSLRELTKLPIMASGGILNGGDGADRLNAGAALVQIYTGFVYSGPALIRDICTAAKPLP